MKSWNWLGMGLAVVLVATAAYAQDATKTTAKEPEKDPALVDVAEQNKYVKEQVDKLKMTMKTLADSLEKSEPGVAAALRKAADEVDVRHISESLTSAIADLEKNMAGSAAEKQKTIINDMKVILEKLRNVDGPPKPVVEDWKKKLEEIKALIAEQNEQINKSQVANNFDKMKAQLDNAMKDIKAVAEEQAKLIDETAKLGEGDPALRKMGDLKDKLDKMIEKQKQLREGTDQDEIGKLALNGEQQRELSKMAEDVAKALAEAGKDPKVADALNKSGADPKAAENASESTKNAANNMKNAADNLSKSTSEAANKASEDQDAALANLQKAQQAMAGAMAKAGGKTPADATAQKQDDLKKRLDAANQAIKDVASQSGQKHDTSKTESAAGDMAKASENLKGQNPQAAKGNQQEALKKLTDEEMRKLAELSRKIEEMAKADPKNTQKQEEIAKKAEDLANQMAQKGEKTPDGAPGKDNMSKGSKSAKSAAGKMSKGGGKSGQSGQQDQEDAKEEMEKAKEKLEQEIAKAEQQQQDQALAKIVDMLNKMLADQQAVSAETRNLEGKKAEGKDLSRPEQLSLGKLSSEEGRLGDETTKIIKMLTDEGSTAVFPQVLKQVEVDLRDLQNMLGEKQTGQLTQAVQGQVEANLQEMINALKQEQDRRKKQQQKGGGSGKGGGGGGGKQPLVPPVAELKMLRTLQLGINGRTEQVAKLKEANALPADQAKTSHERLSGRQKEVENMTLELKDKMQQQGGH